MKTVWLILILLASIQPTYAGKIELGFNYCGENLYIQNPTSQEEFGFCAYQVTLNGLLIMDTMNNLMNGNFEIDLKSRGLRMDEGISLVIYHFDDCKPKIANSEMCHAYNARKQLKITDFTADSLGNLHWKIINPEGHHGVYHVEQFKWNKWNVLTCPSIAFDSTQTNFSFDTEKFLHSRKNLFRIKLIDKEGEPQYSHPVKISSDKDPVTLDGGNYKGQALGFTNTTHVEIYDSYGNLILSKRAKFIDTSALPAGIYYFNYDNSIGEFIKRNFTNK